MPHVPDRWVRASPRERRLIAAAAGIVVLALGWVFVWQPVRADIARLARDLPRERAVLAAARAEADAIVALQRTPSPVTAVDPLAAADRVLAERGLRSATTVLDVQEGRVRLSFAAVRFDALPGLLDALQKTAGLRAADATVTQRVEPGMVRAEFALVR